jgi:hypothetical protein
MLAKVGSATSERARRRTVARFMVFLLVDEKYRAADEKLVLGFAP